VIISEERNDLSGTIPILARRGVKVDSVTLAQPHIVGKETKRKGCFMQEKGLGVNLLQKKEKKNRSEEGTLGSDTHTMSLTVHPLWEREKSLIYIWSGPWVRGKVLESCTERFI